MDLHARAWRQLAALRRPADLTPHQTIVTRVRHLNDKRTPNHRRSGLTTSRMTQRGFPSPQIGGNRHIQALLVLRSPDDCKIRPNVRHALAGLSDQTCGNPRGRKRPDLLSQLASFAAASTTTERAVAQAVTVRFGTQEREARKRVALSTSGAVGLIHPPVRTSCPRSTGSPLCSATVH